MNSYTTINQCSVSNEEWRRRKPNSRRQESPIIRLEIREVDKKRTGLCVSVSLSAFEDQRSCYNTKDEKDARGQFAYECENRFPWLSTMRQRQVLSGARRR